GHEDLLQHLARVLFVTQQLSRTSQYRMSVVSIHPLDVVVLETSHYVSPGSQTDLDPGLQTFRRFAEPERLPAGAGGLRAARLARHGRGTTLRGIPLELHQVKARSQRASPRRRLRAGGQALLDVGQHVGLAHAERARAQVAFVKVRLHGRNVGERDLAQLWS